MVVHGNRPISHHLFPLSIMPAFLTVDIVPCLHLSNSIVSCLFPIYFRTVYWVRGRQA